MQQTLFVGANEHFFYDGKVRRRPGADLSKKRAKGDSLIMGCFEPWSRFWVLEHMYNNLDIYARLFLLLL